MPMLRGLLVLCAAAFTAAAGDAVVAARIERCMG